MAFSSKLKSPELDALFELILMLETQEECYCFFEDICTITEIRTIAQRLEVAKMLRKGVTYQEIAQRLGASTATISRVNRALTYGSSGYKLLLDRLDKQNAEDQ
ncbi:YerC/YecD family TrpR-related protein [Christensenellaceae bacterium OttesenSCG-928-L17]|nr:YerC/YecD family TrpR-related protein [Christensenellaceae bacterium OttesenSCG-928-L17]